MFRTVTNCHIFRGLNEQFDGLTEFRSGSEGNFGFRTLLDDFTWEIAAIDQTAQVDVAFRRLFFRNRRIFGEHEFGAPKIGFPDIFYWFFMIF